MCECVRVCVCVCLFLCLNMCHEVRELETEEPFVLINILLIRLPIKNLRFFIFRHPIQYFGHLPHYRNVYFSLYSSNFVTSCKSLIVYDFNHLLPLEESEPKLSSGVIHVFLCNCFEQPSHVFPLKVGLHTNVQVYTHTFLLYLLIDFYNLTRT